MRQDQKKTHASLNKCLILLSSVLLTLSLTGCPTGPVPKVDLQLFAGSPTEDGVRRNKNEFQKCADPKFVEKVCMPFNNLRALQSVIMSCEKWPEGMQMMSNSEKKHWYKVLTTEKLQ